MKKSLAILLTAASLTCATNSYADSDNGLILGIGAGQLSNEGNISFVENSAYTTETISSSKSDDINFIIGGRFKLFNKFIVSPQITIPNDGNLNRNFVYNTNSNIQKINSSLKQSYSVDYLFDFKLGYLINNKTNLYGSVGYAASKFNGQVNYNEICTFSPGGCTNANNVAVDNYTAPYSSSISSEKNLATYGFGLETEIKDNFLFDINYQFSEKENYNISIAGNRATGGAPFTQSYTGTYQYNKFLVALKYLF